MLTLSSPVPGRLHSSYNVEGQRSSLMGSPSMPSSSSFRRSYLDGHPSPSISTASFENDIQARGPSEDDSGSTLQTELAELRRKIDSQIQLYTTHQEEEYLRQADLIRARHGMSTRTTRSSSQSPVRGFGGNYVVDRISPERTSSRTTSKSPPTSPTRLARRSPSVSVPMSPTSKDSFMGSVPPDASRKLGSTDLSQDGVSTAVPLLRPNRRRELDLDVATSFILTNELTKGVYSSADGGEDRNRPHGADVEPTISTDLPTAEMRHSSPSLLRKESPRRPSKSSLSRTSSAIGGLTISGEKNLSTPTEKKVVTFDSSVSVRDLPGSFEAGSVSPAESVVEDLYRPNSIKGLRLAEPSELLDQNVSMPADDVVSDSEDIFQLDHEHNEPGKGASAGKADSAGLRRQSIDLESSSPVRPTFSAATMSARHDSPASMRESSELETQSDDAEPRIAADVVDRTSEGRDLSAILPARKMTASTATRLQETLSQELRSNVLTFEPGKPTRAPLLGEFARSVSTPTRTAISRETSAASDAETSEAHAPVERRGIPIPIPTTAGTRFRTETHFSSRSRLKPIRTHIARTPDPEPTFEEAMAQRQAGAFGSLAQKSGFAWVRSRSGGKARSKSQSYGAGHPDFSRDNPTSSEETLEEKVLSSFSPCSPSRVLDRKWSLEDWIKARERLQDRTQSDSPV